MAGLKRMDRSRSQIADSIKCYELYSFTNEVRVAVLVACVPIESFNGVGCPLRLPCHISILRFVFDCINGRAGGFSGLGALLFVFRMLTVSYGLWLFAAGRFN